MPGTLVFLFILFPGPFIRDRLIFGHFPGAKMGSDTWMGFCLRYVDLHILPTSAQ